MNTKAENIVGSTLPNRPSGRATGLDQLPAPVGRETFVLLYSKIEQIVDQEDAAVWEDGDLSTIRLAMAYLTECALVSDQHYGFFDIRRQVKPLILRRVDQSRWLELADALRIKVTPALPLGTSKAIDEALSVFEYCVGKSFRARRNARMWCPYRAKWTAAAKETVRSLICLAEHQRDQITSQQLGRYDPVSQELALILTWNTVELWLLADALDADLHHGFRDRFEREMDAYFRQRRTSQTIPFALEGL